jgi:hypothetical protein
MVTSYISLAAGAGVSLIEHVVGVSQSVGKALSDI